QHDGRGQALLETAKHRFERPPLQLGQIPLTLATPPRIGFMQSFLDTRADTTGQVCWDSSAQISS
ncbi:MAG TPA: hypothetical protein VMQ62_14505, partial [Dongiaceae bacterium]|nr:hypothetical protein [Dongiaceae bacterium]